MCLIREIKLGVCFKKEREREINILIKKIIIEFINRREKVFKKENILF